VPIAADVLGALLLVAGAILLRDVGGAATWLIRSVTSRNLGSLAPGYAASPGGMRVYAVLICGLGVAIGGVGLTAFRPFFGLAALGLGVAVFVVASVLIIIGEVRTFRALPKK
jgi:hypothetical protein